jgi:ferritin
LKGVSAEAPQRRPAAHPSDFVHGKQEIMKHSPKIIEALNEQINAELMSFYKYLGMAAYCDGEKFHGSAHWLRLQSQEEFGHAMRLYQFLVSRDSPVRLKSLEPPNQKFASIVDVFETALAQEQEISELINKLYEIAIEERAFATSVELNWFLTEQIEEEKSVRDLVFRWRKIKGDPAALLDLDQDLGQRSMST